MAEKITFTKLVSPKGVAVYPHLNKADDKFGDPVFKVTLRVPTADAAGFVAKIDEMLSALAKGKTDGLREADAKRLTAAAKAKKLKPADPAFSVETDEGGNETGNTLLKFKASGQFKDKDGNIIKRKIKFIDAAKQPIENPPFVWGGSVLRVRAALMPWVNAKAEYGVKLGIDLVQIIELVTSDGSVNTDGFDEEEGLRAAAKLPRTKLVTPAQQLRTAISEQAGLVEWLRGATTGALLHLSAQTTPNPSHRPRVTRSGITYLAKPYAAYIKACQQQFAEQHTGGPIEGRLGVVIETVIEKPKTTKLTDPRGDTDNYAKGCLDAATKAGVSRVASQKPPRPLVSTCGSGACHEAVLSVWGGKTAF